MGHGSGRGFGDRKGFQCRGFAALKRRDDDEATGSSLRPPVSERQRKATCKRDAKSHGTGSKSRAWDNFHRIDAIFDPALQPRRDEELAWFNAKEAATTGDVVAAARVLALREEVDLQATLCSTLIYHAVYDAKPLPRDGNTICPMAKVARSLRRKEKKGSLLNLKCSCILRREKEHPSGTASVLQNLIAHVTP
ncbi:hypothetical protein D1007_26523 [Hordeum vulgare]|nr:hypothetical protein D1007_26523 [Hordeum vulgare]